MTNILTQYLESKTLTAKEIDVIKLMADGHSNKIIADLSGYQEGSVETVRVRIYKKLGVKNGYECVAYALRNKIIV